MMYRFVGLSLIVLLTGSRVIGETLIPLPDDSEEERWSTLSNTMTTILTTINNTSDRLHILSESVQKCEHALAVQNRQIKDVYEAVVGPRDCDDVKASGQTSDGVYRVFPGNPSKRLETHVYCDLETSGQSWLIFQRRKDGSENFERTWVEYVNGFGDPAGEFWLGNEALYLLTSNKRYKLRVDLEDYTGQKRYAEYNAFSVGSSSKNYRLSVTGYSGNAGDSLSGHSGHSFSTKDADHDIHATANCAQLFHGAWWYSSCHASNLNGLYLRGNHTSYADGIEWYSFGGYHHSMKTTEMKIAPAN